MRPPKRRASELLQPLNTIFGTESNVRIVRVLALANTSLTAGELARRAALTRTSIYPAMHELERVGVVEFVGAGSRKLIELRERHPLSRALRDLFRAEAARFERLTVALRELISILPHRPVSAWLDQPGENARSTDTLTLHVVAPTEELGSAVDFLNTRLSDTERKYDVHIAVRGLARSEIDTSYKKRVEALHSIVLLGGVPPAALLERSSRPAVSSPKLTSHDEHDARSRRLALALAEKIKRDPGLIALAADRVERRQRKAGPGERRELAEWIRILTTMSPARLRAFLLEESERAVRLRQTLPALNLLSPEEREAVVRSETDADVIAAVVHR